MGLTIELPPLEPYQREVLRTYLANKHRNWFVIKSPRQVGKSILLECLLIAASFERDKAHSVSISPISSLARKLYNDIVAMGSEIIKKLNNALLEITFINDSTISFYSAESGDNLRGDTIKKDGILCVDEAAYIKENFFYDVAVPFTNVWESDIFIFSTPKFKQGLFYDLYTKGVEGFEDITSFDWTEYDLSKYLSPKTLDMYRKRLPKNVFRSEYLAEFIEGDGAVFSDFKRCVGDFALNPSEKLVLSIDWSCGEGGNADSTVISVMQDDKNKIGLAELYAFNDKKPLDTITTIIDILKKYNRAGFKQIHIILEKNSIGNVYFAMLKKAVDEYVEQYNENADWRNEIDITISLFTTTNSTKKRIIEKLETLFEQNKIVLPNEEKLLTELAMFTAKVNDKGTVIYGVQVGTHDDRVLSLAFGVDYLWSEILNN